MRKPAVRVSLCMIAFNEQDLIARCLRSARSVVDEIVVGVDSRTTDRTAEIARSFGARVIPFEWRDDFSYARNLIFDAARGDWLLVLDADDELTPAGARVVGAIRDRPDAALPGEVVALVFELAELSLEGQEQRRWLGSARLFRRSACPRYSGRVHEQVQDAFWAVLPNGPHIAHLGSDPLLRAQRQKDLRNTRLLELALADDPGDMVMRYYAARDRAFAGDVGGARVHARAALEAHERAERAGEPRLRQGVLRQLKQLVVSGSADWDGAAEGRPLGTGVPDPHAFLKEMQVGR